MIQVPFQFFAAFFWNPICKTTYISTPVHLRKFVLGICVPWCISLYLFSCQRWGGRWATTQNQTKLTKTKPESSALLITSTLPLVCTAGYTLLLLPGLPFLHHDLPGPPAQLTLSPRRLPGLSVPPTEAKRWSPPDQACLPYFTESCPCVFVCHAPGT